MYSRKFGLRLHGKFGNLLKTADYADVTDWGTDSVICGTRIRSRFYVNESSFRLAAECCGFATANPSCGGLAACAPQSAKLAKASGVNPRDSRKISFLGDELSAGSLGCGNDLVEALITAQRIPHGIEAESAVCRASRDRRDNFELIDRAVALARPRVNQRQVGDKSRTERRVLGKQRKQRLSFAQP